MTAVRKVPQIATMTARAERRAIVALFAVFALMVQAFIPSLAAANARPMPGDVICVAHGVQSSPADSGNSKSAPQRGCSHCACPIAFTATPPASAVLAQAVSYPVAQPHVLPAVRQAPGRGLAAPPPPSQGPPLSA